MTAIELYNKFVAAKRAPIEHTYAYKESATAIRGSLYNLRRRRKETFMLRINHSTVTIYEGTNELPGKNSA